MKKLIFTVVGLVALCSLKAQDKTLDAPKATAKKIVPTNVCKNDVDSFSYAAGMSIGESLKQAGVKNLNIALFSKAMYAVFNGENTIFSKELASTELQSRLQNYSKKKTESLKAEGLRFLAQNVKKKGVVTLPNGLQYEVIKEGAANGLKPKAIDTVVVNYVGTLINGTEFDNSFKRGQAATFPLNGVIRGWTEILQLMPKGSTWKVYIPSELAYGANPPSQQIPPNSVLIFTIALEDIKPAVTETK
jgi:FKBP-type peptidyl-prolyl cis-trans isomerase FklB